MDWCFPEIRRVDVSDKPNRWRHFLLSVTKGGAPLSSYPWSSSTFVKPYSQLTHHEAFLEIPIDFLSGIVVDFKSLICIDFRISNKSFEHCRIHVIKSHLFTCGTSKSAILFHDSSFNRHFTCFRGQVPYYFTTMSLKAPSVMIT